MSCAKDGLMQYANISKLGIKIVNFINTCAFKQMIVLFIVRCKFYAKGLVMYNNDHWLTKGYLLERFVKCLHEIWLFFNFEWQSK